MFKLGSVIKINGSPYRIIGAYGTSMVMIQLDIDRYNFFRCGMKTLADIPGIEEIPDPYEQQAFMVSDEELEELRKKQEAIKIILKGISPAIEDIGSNQTCEGVKAFMKTFGVSKSIVHKYIRRYLQSGMDMYSLRDRRKTRPYPKKDMFNSPYKGGRKFSDGSVREPIDPVLEKKYFEEGFRKIDVERSLSYIVDMLNVKYFSKPVLDEEGNLIDIVEAPENKRLSECRFRRYCKERIGTVSMKNYKKGVRELINNDRIKYGTAQTGCYAPGAIVEIDACELDFIIVGKDRRQDLGRPVAYFAVDVFSTKIVGYYIGFENNSFYGATSLFNNMFFGSERILPDSIRVDQGSEWISEGIRRLGKELGIHVKIAPPAMGSYKGLVESSFHAYQKRLRNAGKEYGAIYKVYESRHYEKACLLLEEIKEDVENFIETYNGTSRKNYELSLDMVRNRVRAVPAELWAYGIKYMSVPRPVTEAIEGKIIFSLCVPMKKGTEYNLSRNGFTVKGLTYINTDPLLTDLINKVHFGTGEPDYEVRFDPRTVGHIWARIGKNIIKVPLGEKHDAQQSFKELTWFEYDLICSDMKADKKSLKDADKHLRMLLIAKTQMLMNKGKKKQAAIGTGKNNKKGIRESRKAAQQNDRRKNILGTSAEADASVPQIDTTVPPTQEPELSAPAIETALPAREDDMPMLEAPAEDVYNLDEAALAYPEKNEDEQDTHDNADEELAYEDYF